jgi:hypothetical protein
MKRKKEGKRPERAINTGEPKQHILENPWIALAVMAALGLIVFNRALLPGTMLFGTDYVTGAHMSREFAREVISKLHQVPLWYPAVYGGIPYVDAVAGDLFYPTSMLLRLFMPAHLMTAWNYLLHLLLAGAGVYLFLRSLRLSGAASFLAGLAYMFTGSVTSLMYAGHDAKIIVSALLPWLLLSIDRASRTRKLVWGLAGGIVIGLALLSPHVQMSYYLLLAGFIYGLARLWVLWRDSRDKGSMLKLAGLGLVMLAVGFGLYAIQALPLQYYLKFSPRGQDKGYAFATSYSMPPEEVVNTVWPEFSGLLDKNAEQGPTHLYWGRRDLKLHTEYVGVIPFLLAVLGITYSRRRRLKLFLCGLGLFALIVAWGGFTPLYYLVYYLVPGMSKFRGPAMIFNIAAFAITALAALGAESLLDGAEKSGLKRGLLIALGIGLLFGLIFSAAREGMVNLFSAFAAKGWGAQALWSSYPEMVKGYWIAFMLLLSGSALVWMLISRRIKPQVWAVLTGLLVFLELWRVDARFMKVVDPPETFFAKDEVAAALEKDRDIFRVWPLQVHQQGNYLTLFGLQTVGGEHPNPLKRYNELVGTDPKRLLPDFHNLLQSPQLLNLLNVKYLLMQQPIDYPQFVLQDSCYGGRVKIYRNTTALPRVWLAGDFEVIKEDRAIIERLKSASFDPRSTVILEEPPQGSVSQGRPQGRATVDSYHPNVVELTAESDCPALLVMSDNWYPAWRAEVDGKPAPLYRADYTLRAVPVPAGSHRVVLRYRSEVFQTGLAVSLATAILTVLGMAGCIIHQKRKP